MRVEIVDHAHARLVRAVAERLDVRKTAPGLLPVTHQAPGRGVERSRHVRVRELQPSDLAERAALARDAAHASIPRASAVARWTTRTPDAGVLGAAA